MKQTNNNKNELTSLTLQLTKKCNFNCLFCGQAVSRIVKKEQASLSRVKISEIIKDAQKLGVNIIQLTGGEPTLRKDLISIIQEISSYNIKSNLLTTTYFMDKKYCNKLIDAGLSQLSVSFHSPYEKNHDKVCGKAGSYKKLNKNITYFKLIKPEIEVQITYTTHSLNFNSAYKMLVLAKELSVDTISFSQTVFSHNRINTNLRLSKEQFEKFYFNIVPLLLWKGEEFKIKVSIDPFFPKLVDKTVSQKISNLIHNSDKFDKEINFYFNENYNCDLYKECACVAATNMSRIQADGEVTVCCVSEDAKLNLGNINNQSFLDIWESNKYQKLRDVFNYPISKICRVCKRGFFKEK